MSEPKKKPGRELDVGGADVEVEIVGTDAVFILPVASLRPAVSIVGGTLMADRRARLYVCQDGWLFQIPAMLGGVMTAVSAAPSGPSLKRLLDVAPGLAAYCEKVAKLPETVKEQMVKIRPSSMKGGSN